MDNNKWLSKLDLATEKYQTSFSGMIITELNWKPNEKTWSVGQCIDHIITTNRLYFPIIEGVLAGSYKKAFMAYVPGMTSFLGNMIFKSLNEDRRKKIKTFPVFEPSQSQIQIDVLERFLNQQANLKQLISRLEEQHLNTAISSPVNKQIVYKLHKALDIICTHEMRHYYQAIEVLDLRPVN